jgi:hypothetical protein
MIMGRPSVDISGLDIVEALKTNSRRLSLTDMRNLLREAAEEIENLRADLEKMKGG